VAGEERLAPCEFAVLRDAFCNRADHVITSRKWGTKVAGRRLTFGEHRATFPFPLMPSKEMRARKFRRLAVCSGLSGPPAG
jgi:hypothetical protein